MTQSSLIAKAVRVALAGCAFLCVTLQAQAADAAAAAAAGDADDSSQKNALQEITVLGQRTTVEIAREAQLQAPNLIDITTADEMLRLPDVNTGEAVRRIPGISLETDTGEGRYINIRGMDADLNSTTFGGLRLPPTNNSSPSGAGRAVAFDSIPVGFVGAITVTKTNLPEQDAEALGGTIDITPKTAPLDGKPSLDLKLGTGYELLRHTWVTDGALTASTRFGGSGDYQPFSILGTAALYTDRRGIDDAEAGFTDQQDQGVPDKAFNGFEQRYYRYHRKRHGYGVDFGFEPDADNKWFIRYYDMGYSETVLRNRLVYNVSGTPTVDPANPNGLVDSVTFSKTLRDEKEYLKSHVFEIGGRNVVAGDTLDYHVGYTSGSFEKPYDINSNFDNGTPGVVAYDNTTRPNWPTFAVTGVNPYDPAGYTLTGLSNQTQHSYDHEWGIGANLKIPTDFTHAEGENIKVGVNARLRNRVASAQNLSPDTLPNLTLDQASFGNNVLFYQAHYLNGPQINPLVLRSIYANSTIVDDTVTDAQSYQNDRENVFAGYGQYEFNLGPVGIIAGARVENTRARYAANQIDDNGTTTTVTPVSRDKSYTNFFPTAQARYEITPDLIGRFAVSSTIARPGFNQVTASTTIDPSGSVSTGNPELKPITSTGIDLSIEKYLSQAGIASFGIFDKEIRDYIVTQESSLPGRATGSFVGQARLFTFANASQSRLFGLEANYVQHFRDLLPGAFGGLGVSTNWTWVQSRYDIRPGEQSVLPSTSRNTVNAQLLYDWNPVNLSLGAYYTSRNIFGVGSSAATDVWTQERLSVDFGSQYKITDLFSVYFNAKNLTNTALKLTEGPGDNRVIQREFYGVTLQAGVNIKL